jgi:ribosomal protein S18 acetylase RimI-like enzyme
MLFIEEEKIYKELVFKEVSLKDKYYYNEIIKMMEELNKTIVQYHYSKSLQLQINLHPNKNYFILENLNKEVIGFSIGWQGHLDEKTFTIDDLYIKPQFRHLGYGTYILNELSKYAKINKCSHLVLTVAKNNKPAYNNYVKFGFFPTKYIMVKHI